MEISIPEVPGEGAAEEARERFGIQSTPVAVVPGTSQVRGTIMEDLMTR